MQILLNQDQTRAADAFTIQKKGMSSIELMEAASLAFVSAFMEEVRDQTSSITVLCGKGNNGGDGLAISRILKDKGYQHISVYLILFSTGETEEYKMNLKRLEEISFPLFMVKVPEELPDLANTVVIDAVLGSGLNKELAGPYRQLALKVNKFGLKVIAVDVPTGFPAEGPIFNKGVFLKADLVICFQRPKLNFFFPESVAALDRFKVVPIGLDEEFIQQCDSSYRLVESSDIRALVKPRKSFTHKGTYGHALIIAGQQETMGAALLAARACLHGGAGLTTLSIPDSGLTALNTSLPEVMYLNRDKLNTRALKKFKVIAIGPGLGVSTGSAGILKTILRLKQPIIIDADALNLLGDHADLLKLLPSGSILTPHMKEFDHLFGIHQSWWERLQTAKIKAAETECVIVLKNQYTFIIAPDGNIYINPTGNPAMAQGGMGDVLTGLVSSFSAQGFTNLQSALIACYVHGRSGDELAYNQVSTTASQVVEHVAKTLKGLIK